MLAPMRHPRGQFLDPWRLVRVATEADPGAGEHGLLDPAVVEEPELPRAGLLGRVDSREQAATDGEAIRSLPDHVQHRLGVDEVVEDGDVGDVTYTRLSRLLNAGFGSRLRNDIADRALVYFGGRYKNGVPKSIEERMNQYR